MHLLIDLLTDPASSLTDFHTKGLQHNTRQAILLLDFGNDKYISWAEKDSNLQSTVYQPGALPLRHPPKSQQNSPKRRDGVFRYPALTSDPVSHRRGLTNRRDSLGGWMTPALAAVQRHHNLHHKSIYIFLMTDPMGFEPMENEIKSLAVSPD